MCAASSDSSALPCLQDTQPFLRRRNFNKQPKRDAVQTVENDYGHSTVFWKTAASQWVPRRATRWQALVCVLLATLLCVLAFLQPRTLPLWLSGSDHSKFQSMLKSLDPVSTAMRLHRQLVDERRRHVVASNLAFEAPYDMRLSHEDCKLISPGTM